MGILDWLFQRPQFKRFDDSYALIRESLWNALQRTVNSEQHALKSIWLVTHFTDTFTTLQDRLDSWGREYDVVAAPIDANALERSNLLSPSSFKLVLAEMIPDAFPNMLEVNRDQTIAMIVLERHPHPKYDDRIVEFAKSLPCLVEFGHYLSLDDEVVKTVISETTLTILKQLGMDEHELITTSMVSRRMNVTLGRNAEEYSGDQPADSAKEWLELNS